MSRDVSNSEDILDSRDIIARQQELADERAELADALDEARSVGVNSEAHEAAATALADWDNENGAELKTLTDLCEEGSGYSPDWKYGATLIRDSYFEAYAREFAEDIGAVKSNAEWPGRCIDWEKAAEELQQDYTALDYDGVTYWVR